MTGSSPRRPSVDCEDRTRGILRPALFRTAIATDNQPMNATKRRVLVVDDEDQIRTFAERVLHQGGYEATTTSNGADALTLVEQQGPFDLYVIDVMMPIKTGDELARELRRMEPDAKILYFTGYPDRLFAEKATLWANEAFVEKPVTVAGLLEAVSLLLFGHVHGSH
jgi:two-component system cell cycle sensor histidine kinase/response regulator CckA